MIPSDSTVLQTLQHLMFVLETQVKQKQEDYLIARHEYKAVSQQYKDIRTLYEEKYALLNDATN